MPSTLYNERKDRMLKITLWKRVTAVLIIGAFGALLMTGCASKEASQDSSLNAASESSLASPTTEAAAAEETLSEDELKERGVNFSMTHEDFMVGSADLSIIGTTHEGEEVEIFKDGNFTF